MNTHWQHLLGICALCLACWSGGMANAHAQDVTGTLNTAWEAFWQQSGYPRPLYKWQTPLRVRFSGASAERHKELTLRRLREVTQLAGLTVSEAAADDTTANVLVEFFSAEAPLPGNQTCHTNFNVRNFAIGSATIKANDQSAWRCMSARDNASNGLSGASALQLDTDLFRARQRPDGSGQTAVANAVLTRS